MGLGAARGVRTDSGRFPSGQRGLSVSMNIIIFNSMSPS